MTSLMSIDPTGQPAVTDHTQILPLPAQDVPVAGLAQEVEAIRGVALACGLFPAVAVSRAISAALERGEQGPLIIAWVEMLRATVLRDQRDADARDSAASASPVRRIG
ncbi:hypothetical protein QCD71_11445 [Sphingomonas sp. PsM26]|nr:hypothetical protein [Sphingomonas sp. PsM26]